MFKNGKMQIIAAVMAIGVMSWANCPAGAAVRIEGQVAGGGPVAKSTVALWGASAGAPGA